MSKKNLSLGDAAVHVLTEAGEPLHYREITKRVLEQGIAESNSKTPDASMAAVLTVDLKSRGQSSRFVRTRPGVFGLRSWRGTDGTSSEPVAHDEVDGQQRVRVPLFPEYSEVRHVLRTWTGKPRARVTQLQSTIGELRGTPQAPVDWTEPYRWIPERLQGHDQVLAMEIWKSSQGQVNPRYVYGHWLLARRYDLLSEDAAGILHLTKRGQDFIEHPAGDTERLLDDHEGLLKILSLVATHGPARVGELETDWGEYLKRWSGFGSDSTIKDTLRRRLRNLLERGLISRSTAQYNVTDAGLAYLRQVAGDELFESSEEPRLLTLAKEHNDAVRASIHDLLSEMDPFAVEHLVKRLLEAMNYENVQVTARSNDKGVDVVADIELGISSVREVVQVKRHRKTIQRRVMDALRGSLHRFGAVRGTIITTGTFSAGTREAAFEPGAAPITLIDGEKLVDLLIEHGIGVRKEPLMVLELDHGAFTGVEDGLGGDCEVARTNDQSGHDAHQ